MKSMEKFKNLSFGEKIKIVAESWRKLNDDQKVEYTNRAEED